jgi:hypothetical protein
MISLSRDQIAPGTSAAVHDRHSLRLPLERFSDRRRVDEVKALNGDVAWTVIACPSARAAPLLCKFHWNRKNISKFGQHEKAHFPSSLRRHVFLRFCFHLLIGNDWLCLAFSVRPQTNGSIFATLKHFRLFIWHVPARTFKDVYIEACPILCSEFR